jgi:hypothetical protein
MLAGLGAGDDQAGVLRMERRDIDRVDIGVREEGCVVTIGGGVPGAGGQREGPRPVRTRHGGEDPAPGRADPGDEVPGYTPSADDPPAARRAASLLFRHVTALRTM